MKNKSITVFRYTIALIITVFGLLTLFLSSGLVFDWFGIRAQEGNYVLFVAVANLICSFLYLFAGYGIITKRIWTTKVLTISAGVLLITFIAFQVHIYSGGIYETKTFGALIFRITMTLLFVTAAFFLNKSMKNEH
ncbi:MAG: hypothetical protein J0L62_05490 [Bacteroidetes bacterium]|nr:hypothetical protein [Bacteroidota bacterium]